ncbi:hypothetical protein Poly41_23740 [Novipirellula artificiosorum]|uniref:Uncharacterized protein n=1 Tax=Novipirellula artificiosorum TaxID=2528016 RepID=A0A5C6DXH0_9BACT|nr:hypothetical protein Poly41_23740 [Novipirellula artificiosorum]
MCEIANVIGDDDCDCGNGGLDKLVFFSTTAALPSDPLSGQVRRFEKVARVAMPFGFPHNDRGAAGFLPKRRTARPVEPGEPLL